MLSCLLVISEHTVILCLMINTPLPRIFIDGVLWNFRASCDLLFLSIAYNFVWSGIQYYIIMHTTLFNTESYDITCFILWNNTVYLYNMILPVHIRQNKKNRIHRIYRLSTMTSGYKQDFHYVPYPAPRLWNHLGCS